MNWPLLTILVVLAMLFTLYLNMTASRLDRLHRRIDTATLALDAQLVRRSAMAAEIAGAGLLDPVSSALLADAAHAARTAPEDDSRARGLAESDLTGALGAVFGDPDDVEVLGETAAGRAYVEELTAAARRVELSRRFLNDGVRACRAVRGQWLVRLFHLAGRTPWPDTFEMDDTLPGGLSGR
ncbi:MAG: hypothetical protein EPO13_06505 [Actinomycetota bacterium]|nr:MAG: hypothetical protein EPO13_06505 [Actinomycetota bacterium]